MFSSINSTVHLLISDYLNVHILDINYCDLLQKPLEIRDVFDIIKEDISSSLHEVGGCLGTLGLMVPWC